MWVSVNNDRLFDLSDCYEVKYSYTACCLRFRFYHREDETVDCNVNDAEAFIQKYCDVLSGCYPLPREPKVLYLWTSGKGRRAEALGLLSFKNGEYIKTKNSTAISCNVLDDADDIFSDDTLPF